MSVVLATRRLSVRAAASVRMQRYGGGSKTMSEAAAAEGKALVVGVGTRMCAISLTHVIEIMRPLPVEGISDAPLFVRGVAIIRGIPTPVVDLGLILGAESEMTDERFVTIRLGMRQVAIRVNSVYGIHDLEALPAQELPPLLRGTAGDVVEKIGTLDEQLLLVLRSGWKLPDETWAGLLATQEVS